MNKIYLLIVFALFYSKTFAEQKIWIPLASPVPAASKSQIHSISFSETEVTLNVSGFYKSSKATPRGTAYSISIPGCPQLLEAGLPDLPLFTFSLAIPDNAVMQVEILSSDYTDIPLAVAPSKGNLKRDKDPGQVPYVYNSLYSVDGFYPTQLTKIRDPYILRDYRGQTIVLQPFQYNPVRQVLRVYHSMRVKVSPAGTTGSKNVFRRNKPLASVDATYSSIYKSQFLNSSVLNYSPLTDHGKMLVISDAGLIAAMQPFINWKNRMGQATEIVDVATIGSDPNAIKSYIENYYNTNGLTFVLLVGDGPQIPPFPSSYGDSDPSYGFLTGNDTYAEVIVGRFSANDSSELVTQVERSMNYEMYPAPNEDWYKKAVCIASNQGPGDDQEMDWEHERNIRDDLLAYTYNTIDELYDGSQGQLDSAGDPSSLDLISSLNAGRGLISYTGHGSSASLGTTGFASSDVYNLNNPNQLPFIFSVACVNGNFNNSTCLAEALMRATNGNGEPIGAIATLMSTINQSWDPPMDAQDEMIDLLIESYPGNVKHTFGGISVNGCMHMNDEYGTDGDEMTATWNLFGDPSLMVRTDRPEPLLVSHNPVIDASQLIFTVTSSLDGSLVCLSHNNTIISTTTSLSGIAYLLPAGLQPGDTLDLVVTAYNAIPYYGKVIVTNGTSGINSLLFQQIAFFPNPTEGMLQINLPENGKSLFVKIVDTSGKNVFEVRMEKNTIDVSELKAGIYAMIFYDNEKVVGIEKLIKK